MKLLNRNILLRALRWLLVVPVCLVSAITAYIGLILLDRGLSLIVRTIHIFPHIALSFSSFMAATMAFILWMVPTVFALGYAISIPVRIRLLWGVSAGLLLAILLMWWLFGSDFASKSVALCAGAILVGGVVTSFFIRSRPIHLIANIVVFLVLTVPYCIEWAAAPKLPPNAQKLWSVVLDKGSWQAMNTGSSFEATRRLVFAGDRLLAVFEVRSAGYEGQTPMSIYRLVSMDRKSGAVSQSEEFKSRWGDTPLLFATSDGHVVMSHGSLLSLNPDLTSSGSEFKLDRGRAIEMSPDGKTIAWETTPGTTLIDANTLTLTAMKLPEAVPRSVSAHGVLTDNIYWYGEYPNDKAFVTLTDEQGQHLLFHGECAGQSQFLNDAQVLIAGCGKMQVVDLKGNVVQEQKIEDGPVTIAGIAQNGKRFALEFNDIRGDPPALVYEQFIIYDTSSLNAIATVNISDLPEYCSWSAFSPDSMYFAAGNPANIGLYRLP